MHGVCDPSNYVSRFCSISKVYLNQHTLNKRESHACINFVSVYIDMLAFGASVPHASGCIVIAECTITLRHPLEVYRIATSWASRDVVDPCYNVCFHTNCPPQSLPKLARGNSSQLVNNKEQALFSIAFITEALPTLRIYCAYFCLEYSAERVYSEKSTFRSMGAITVSMADEFWFNFSFTFDFA